MCPKWNHVTNLAKDNKVCCAFFCTHTRAQVCVPLTHAGLDIRVDPEGPNG